MIHRRAGDGGDLQANATAPEVSALLRAWSGGDEAARDRLLPALYDDLRRIARAHMRKQRAGDTLQATALVNEVYLRLAKVKNISLRDRAQFLALCSHVMRRILVDSARAKGARKRGAAAGRINLDEIALPSPGRDEAVVALDAALERLTKLAPRQAQVVEMRYFGGLSEREIGAILKTTTRTVERDWKFARSWLLNEISR